MIVGVDRIVAVIPGAPQAQQRMRATKRGDHAGVYEPEESRSWKGSAKVVMQAAVFRATGDERAAPPWDVDIPLHVEIVAIFECPRSEYRKRDPRPRRWALNSKDVDNIAKAVLDAGNGVLWLDDRQVSVLRVGKVIGSQGEAPAVMVRVTPVWLDCENAGAWEYA